jgi:hypothetical protein
LSVSNIKKMPDVPGSNTAPTCGFNTANLRFQHRSAPTNITAPAHITALAANITAPKTLPTVCLEDTLYIYQVCSRPTNKTGITTYHQQENILRLEPKDDRRPQKHFQKDLISLLKTWKQNGESIIPVGDLNEPLVPDTSNMAKVVQELDLVDIFSHRHPHLPEPTTYIRGRHRIVYALLSQDLCTSVTACSYEPFHYRTTSDHRQLFLDFDTTKLFCNDNELLAAMAFRDIRSKDAKSNTVYLTAKYQHLDRQKHFKVCDQLSTSACDNALAARLDDICTQGAVHGGKKGRSRRRSW